MNGGTIREQVWRHVVRREREEAVEERRLYDVFLGGSCGNTVWRQQEVIPHLRLRGISFYDPQRSQWSKELINEEAVAKENSRIFLFVLDPTNVNASSFIEIAYFAARRDPKLVVVFLRPHEWNSRAHPKDVADRGRCSNLMECILDRHAVPLMHSLDQALLYIDQTLIGSMHWPDAIRDPHKRLPFISMKWHQWRWHLSWRDGLCLFSSALSLSIFFFLRHIPFAVFLLLNALFFSFYGYIWSYRNCSSNGRKRRGPLLRRDSTGPRPVGYDVFLACSASSPSDLQWVTDFAIPQLNKKGLSYTDSGICGDTEKRLKVMSNSRHILYYIPSFRTFLSGIVEVAYLLGQKDWQVTVCVSNEAIWVPVEGESSEEKRRVLQKRNDCYAMAFCYLNDMAARRHCRLFTRLTDALSYVILETSSSSF